MGDDKHEFVASDLDPLSCSQCGMIQRADVHLIETAIPVAKQLVITVSEVGLNISINGAFDASELALISLIVGDMARQNLAAQSQMAANQFRPMDHLKKKGN